MRGLISALKIATAVWITLSARDAAAGTHEDLVLEHYRTRIVPLAARKCGAAPFPDEISITDSLEIGAGAFMERVDPETLEFRPRIGLQRGIIEFSAALAYFHTLGTSQSWKTALEILYFKAKSPFASIHANSKWSTWERFGPGLRHWHAAFLSRVSFYIAHELGHHCLRHTSGGGLELSGIRDSNGKPLRWQLAINNSAARDPAHSRMLESAADQWALEFMMENRNSLGFEINEEAFLSGVAELALLDAAMGRVHAAGSANTWSHPVELARFTPIFNTASTGTTSANTLPLASYVRNLNHALICIREKGEPLDRLRQFIESELYCLLFSTNKPALDVFLASAAPPLHNTKWRGADISIATVDGGDMTITARRAEDAPIAGRFLANESISDQGEIWEATVNNDEEYVFQIRDAPKEGEIAVRVDGELVGKGTFKGGKLVDVRRLSTAVKTKLKGGDLVLSVSSDDLIKSAEDL